MIELKHITKVYGNFKALDDVSLTIKDGEIYGIVGESGAGKSTLVRCINMLEPPTTGEVLINAFHPHGGWKYRIPTGACQRAEGGAEKTHR